MNTPGDESIAGVLGQTRARLRSTHLLHTPDTFVRTPMPGLRNGLAIVHASPELGAKFLQYTAELEPHGVLEPVATQRFVFVLEGEAEVRLDGAAHLLRPGSYAFFPTESPFSVRATSSLRLIVIEKAYDPCSPFERPSELIAHEDDLRAQPLAGDPNVMVKSLLPQDFAFDFAVNTMTYAPGAALAQVEVHVMEHGLLMLEGGGTYRLDDDSYEVQAGDFIWMSPYCPQWFRATATAPAKYLIYKDWNRRPRL